MHIYAFGSICRGDISLGSDVDLLAIEDSLSSRFDPEMFSIYPYGKIVQLWQDGNPFAWHLHFESRLLFASDKIDFINTLGKPSKYKNCMLDCKKFQSLFRESSKSIRENIKNRIFDLSIVFLSVRNFATCYSLGTSEIPDFSRKSALNIGNDSLEISGEKFSILEKSRILCTRGYGEKLKENDINDVIDDFENIDIWMERLIAKVGGKCSNSIPE